MKGISFFVLYIKQIYEIPFPLEALQAIIIRHDLVHRNGKNKKGEVVVVMKQDVLELINNANLFVVSINLQVNKSILGDASDIL